MNKQWILKRNCSLSPRQLSYSFAVLSVLSFAVAFMFTLYGLWYVLIFSMLEIVVLALAFLYYARHATDHELISLIEGCLLIERVEAGQVQQTRLDPYWTRVTFPIGSQDLINLEAKGVKIEVGRFVTEERRQLVAQELRRELRGGMYP